MKQVAQRLRDGRVSVVDVPPPALRPEGVLVDVRASVLSPGTERKKVETGRQSLLGKARSRPEETRRVVDKARRDGIAETVQAVRARLEQPSALGYASAGVVLAAGARVSELAAGDRVACSGGGYALHAEVNYVPGNLAVRVPAKVTFEEAAFATLGAIALHSVRQADVRLGERVAVVGLGLVGQLAGQILRAAGCRVVGVDLEPELVALALAVGGADVAYSRESLEGRALPADAQGCDAVVIAAATRSSDPIRLAADLCRDKGRVVVVGDVGIDVPRDAYYEKELELRASRSYGPGRYDREYEERGLDYPIGYVRWTERRNMAAFLELVAGEKVNVEPLITERVPIDRAADAYERLVSPDRSPLAIVLEYAATAEPRRPPRPTAPPARRAADRIGVIGAGSFASRILIPGLRDAGFALAAVASASGLSAQAAADRFGFERAATSDEIIDDPSLALVAIATRHASHAGLAARALRAGKAVYVEKPPCLTRAELEELRAARDESGQLLAVGFNRRLAPLSAHIRRLVAETARPFELVYRVNAGRLPHDHWLNDLDDGGGRLLGEGCHFVDFACWVADEFPEQVTCTMRADPGRPLAAAQNFVVTLRFAGGSLATLVYAADGSASLAKEYVEAHSAGRSAVLDDFRSVSLLDGARRRRHGGRRSDKGHAAQFRALYACATGEEALPPPDPLDSMAVTLAALDAAELGSSLVI